MTFQTVMYHPGRRNYHILHDFLRQISYKPGWNIEITEEQNSYSFIVTCTFEGYESEHAAFFPLAAEDKQVTGVRARLQGKTVRHREKRYFQKRFDMLALETLRPEDIIRYVIADTIKQAEMFEFNRWFKVEGDQVFNNE